MISRWSQAKQCDRQGFEQMVHKTRKQNGLQRSPKQLSEWEKRAESACERGRIMNCTDSGIPSIVAQRISCGTRATITKTLAIGYTGSHTTPTTAASQIEAARKRRAPGSQRAQQNARCADRNIDGLKHQYKWKWMSTNNDSNTAAV